MNITFSWKALIIIILPMLPNIIYFINPPTDITAGSGTVLKIIGIIENISRSISFMLLLFLSKNPNANFRNPLAIAMWVFLLLYFILWGRYFFGGGSYSLLGKSFLGIPMAIFPVCYFICAAFLLNCLPAVISLVIFGTFHIISHLSTF